jgi:hypothetical protein
LTITLQNNSGNDLSPTANGSFTFTTKLANAATYSVAVSTQPANMTCTVTNGSGTISSADVSNIAVACVYTNKIIFITNTTTTGNIGSIAAADAICMADANKPADAATYKAMIVDGTSRVACTTPFYACAAGDHVDWVMAASTAYYRSDATTLIATTNSSGIFDLSASNVLTNSFSSVFYDIWTGMAGDWTTGDTCSKWATGDVSTNGAIGATDKTNSQAIFVVPTPCNAAKYLACVAQ